MLKIISCIFSGKEGKQASLAADWSLTQFCHVSRLLLVHGRNSYKRSAALYFSSVSLYPGFMMVGFSTVYTMFPVFSLVLDKDVSGRIALMYPELYKDLAKGRSLTFKTFFIW